MPQEEYIESFISAIEVGSSATTAVGIIQAGLNFVLTGVIGQFLGMVSSLQLIFV
jgi:hypothetical protein